MAIQANAAAGSAPVQRYGCFSLRIGSSLNHKLEKDLTMPESHRLIRRGMTIHLDVQDITRDPNPSYAAHTKWICRHADCKGQTWGTKGELVASHENERQLAQKQEAHCFYAVAWIPAIFAAPVKLDKEGQVVEEAKEATPPRVVLLSDED